LTSIRRTLPAGALVAALCSLAVAACGGGGATEASNAPAKSPSTTAATVNVANTGLGKILVDSAGRTLYLFKADSGNASACVGACAAAWPPLLASGRPTVSGGANAALIATIKRANGTEQVTYNGHPLYLFAADTKAGATTGEGVTAFGAPWYVVSPSGGQITSQSSSGANSSPVGSSAY
jgi:predicted lipoprotein with Yx(FWY)xxD motif